MKLTEYEGKELFRSYGIRTPEYALVTADTACMLPFPVLLKSQVPVGDRKKKGGIVLVQSPEEFATARARLLALSLDGLLPEFLLAEEYVAADEELYVSFSYSSDTRTPMLSLNRSGGSGVHEATVVPISILKGVDDAFIQDALRLAQIPASPQLIAAISSLWRLFQTERLFLAEINPLFLTSDGGVCAGDAKIVQDDALLPPTEKEIVPLGGDIAVIASGGGASMLNIDMLMRAGGKPANYVEYSGNPPASVVEELTVRVLSQPGLRGAWVVGGTANFTDTYETLSGFAAGLTRVVPKPAYPIVVRRDGPRQQEAKKMLELFARDKDFDLTVFGPELSMAASAAYLLTKMRQI